MPAFGTPGIQLISIHFNVEQQPLLLRFVIDFQPFAPHDPIELVVSVHPEVIFRVIQVKAELLRIFWRLPCSSKCEMGRNGSLIETN